MDINSFVIGYKKGKASGGGGGGSGGGVELNIAYGDTAPEDTTKLWVKTTQPSGVVVSADIEMSQNETIETLTTKLPANGLGSGVVAVGKTIYLFGGRYKSTTMAAVKTIRCFDTETETITTLSATLPVAMQYASAVYAREFVYLFCGGSIYMFDIETKTITTHPTKLTYSNPISSYATALVGDNIYIFSQERGEVGVIERLYTPTNDVYTVTNNSSMGFEDLTAFSSGENIYLCCGTDYTDTLVYSNKIEKFNTSTNSFEVLTAEFPTQRQDVGCTTIGTKAYIWGGESSSTGSTVYFDTIYCFDMEKETLEERNAILPNTMTYPLGASVDGSIYMFGGLIYPGGSATNQIIKYVPPGEEYFVDNGVVHIIPSCDGNNFPLIQTETAKVEIGVSKAYKGNTEGIGEEVEAALYKDGAWTTI